MNTTYTGMVERLSEEKMAQVVTLSGLSEAAVADFLYYDWDNGDEHAEWLKTADAEEIADWVKSCYEDTLPETESYPMYTDINQEREEIAALCGGSWDEVVEWLGGMTVAEIKAAADYCWPQEDDNQAFAERVYDAL